MKISLSLMVSIFLAGNAMASSLHNDLLKKEIRNKLDEIEFNFHPASVLTVEQASLLDSLKNARLGGKPEKNQFKEVLQRTKKETVQSVLRDIRMDLPGNIAGLNPISPVHKNPKGALRLLANSEFFISKGNIYQKRQKISYFYFNMPVSIHSSGEDEH